MEFKQYFEFPSQEFFDEMTDQEGVHIVSIDIYASENQMNIGGF